MKRVVRAQEPKRNDRRGPTTSGRTALTLVLGLTLSTIGIIYALVHAMH
jgi:hypothetical protein